MRNLKKEHEKEMFLRLKSIRLKLGKLILPLNRWWSKELEEKWLLCKTARYWQK
jgi:hypothetical protein